MTGEAFEEVLTWRSKREIDGYPYALKVGGGHKRKNTCHAILERQMPGGSDTLPVSSKEPDRSMFAEFFFMFPRNCGVRAY